MYKLLLLVIACTFSCTLLEPRISNDNIDKYLQQQKRLYKDSTAHILLRAGFPSKIIPIVTCIAEKESHFKPGAVNHNHNNTNDYGLLQINTVWLKKCDVTPTELKNPHINAKCALIVYNKQGLRAWYTYRKNTIFCNKYKVTNINKFAL